MADNRALHNCLADLEARIVPEVELDVHRQWVDFLENRLAGGIFTPRRPRPAPPRVEWPQIRVNQALADYDAMALQQYGACSEILAAGGGGVLCVRCNYGSSILPLLFGVKVFVMDDTFDTLPTSEPLHDRAAIRRLIAAGVPDLDGGYGAQVFEMARRFLEFGRQYPKLGRFVPIYHPDLQGPMDVCEVVWGSDVFLELVDDPGLVGAFLDLVVETYLAFMRRWQALVPSTGPYATHWHMLHKGRIFLRNDSVMNLSPAMYETHVAPRDQRLLEALGGGGVHFCGHGDHYIPTLGRMPGLTAVNLSQPEMNDMETIYRHTVDRGIKLLGLRRQTAEQALAAGRDLRGQVHCA